MQQDIVLKQERKTENIEIEIYIAFGRATAPISGIVLYCHFIVCESVSSRKSRKSRRQFSLGLTTQCLDFGSGRHFGIARLLFLTGNCLQNPFALEHKEGLGGGIRHYIRQCHAHSFQRMNADADTSTADTFAECDGTDLRVIDYFFRYLCHFWSEDTNNMEKFIASNCFIGFYAYLCGRFNPESGTGTETFILKL